MMKPQQLPADTSVDLSQMESWMRSAVDIASSGVAKGESPFGALIVSASGEVAAREHNTVRSSINPSAHAEVMAIAAAAKSIGQLKLKDHWLVATGEPCPMCLATAAMSGISRVVFGAPESVIAEAGYATLGIRCRELAEHLNHAFHIVGPVLESECAALLLSNRKN